jgi:hypothetical protein
MNLTHQAQERLRKCIEQLQQNDSLVTVPLNPCKPSSMQVTRNPDLLQAIYHKVTADNQVYFLGTKK